VARAKGTDRAEARRRYRAIVKAQEEAEAGSEGQEAVAVVPTRNRGRGSQALKPLPQPQVAQRPGFFGAARAAYRPVHYREDVRYIVPLITRTHAVWPVLVLTIVAVPLALSRPNVKDDPILSVVLFFLSPMPIVPAMIAGFLAPRATWLAGLIDGFIVGIGLLVLVVLAGVSQLGFNKVPPDQVFAVSVSIFSSALPFGALLAAGTGWYKRFLSAMPGAGPRQAQRRKAK